MNHIVKKVGNRLNCTVILEILKPICKLVNYYVSCHAKGYFSKFRSGHENTEL